MIDHPLLIQSNFLVSKICNSRPLFILSCHQSPVLYMFFMKLCWWLDSNCGRLLVPKATTLSTESQPFSYVILSSFFPKLKLRQSLRPRRVLKKKNNFLARKSFFGANSILRRQRSFLQSKNVGIWPQKNLKKLKLFWRRRRRRRHSHRKKSFFIFNVVSPFGEFRATNTTKTKTTFWSKNST